MSLASENQFILFIYSFIYIFFYLFIYLFIYLFDLISVTANSSLIANMAKERKKMCRMKWRRIQEQIKRRLNVSWSKFIKAIRIGLRLSQGSKVGRPSRKGDVLYMAVQVRIYTFLHMIQF